MDQYLREIFYRIANHPRIAIVLGLMLAIFLPRPPDTAALDGVAKCEYVIVQSESTASDREWQEVLETLRSKHAELDPLVLVYKRHPKEILERLSEIEPRYTCFLSPHGEVDPAFVADIHKLTRALDQDPYTDTFWGILTGYDKDNALAIAGHSVPLQVEKVLSATEIAMEKIVEGYWYDELRENHYVRKRRGGEAEELECPSDTTAILVAALNEYEPDLLVTSGHATARNWQIGYGYKNGTFRSENGAIYGVDLQGGRHAVDSGNPKIYLPIGNCLMGSIPDENAMALAWMNSAGIVQMIGYTVPTWFGYAGWGVLDYFLEQPGRYTLTEAFFANQQALVHALETEQGNQTGLKHDSTVVAFYGDPAWQARMAEGPLHYGQKLVIEDDVYKFTITPQNGADSFAPVSENGSQRGGRPIIQFLPHPIGEFELIEGQDLDPVIADDFILVPNPGTCDPERNYTISFRAAHRQKRSGR